MQLKTPEIRAELMRLRSWIKTLRKSSLLAPEDKARVRLHARAVAVAEWEILQLEEVLS